MWPDSQGFDEPAWIEGLISFVLYLESESVSVSPTVDIGNRVIHNHYISRLYGFMHAARCFLLHSPYDKVFPRQRQDEDAVVLI